MNDAAHMVVHVTKSKTVAVSTFADASAAVLAHWGSKSSAAFYRDQMAGRIDGADANVSFNGSVFAGTNRMAVNATKLY